MKKYFLALVVVIVSMVMTFGCSGDSNPAEPAATPTITATAIPTITVEFQYELLPSAAYIPTETKDAKLMFSNSTYNNGGAIQVDLGESGGGYLRGVLKFDLALITDSGVTVNSAELVVNTVDYSGIGTSATVYELTQAWTEGTTTGTYNVNASWDFYDGTGNSWATAGGDYNALAASNAVALNANSTEFTFNLSAAVVEGWINTPSSNHGMILLNDSPAAGTNWVGIASKEYPTAAKRPKLVIHYTP